MPLAAKAAAAAYTGSAEQAGFAGRGLELEMYSLMIAFALCNLLYLALHVTSGGSFPKPLSQKEERECLEKIKEGDQEAKNRLIEHNLRLVAHIIKLIYNKCERT